MKKTLFIVGGIAAVLVLFAIWLYLLIYGTPKPVAEFFTDFSLFSNTTPADNIPSIEQPLIDAPVTVDVSTEKLRQLTTRPVAGFVEFKESTTSPRFIRYAEAGTGHIYSINLTTGEEIRLSNTTVPNGDSAVFSPNGTYVAIRSGYGTKSEIVLLTLNADNTSTAENLTPKMTDFVFSNNNELLYTELTSGGTAGRSIAPATKIISNVFTIPFQAVTLVWSTNNITPHYIYPKATSKLMGYLYTIRNGVIVRQTPTGQGLMAGANSNILVHTELINNTPSSFITNLGTGAVSPAPIIFEPHKCTFGKVSTSTMYCGYEITQYGPDYPDAWYQGARSFADRIWKIDLKRKSATQLISPETAVGRSIDIINMHIGRGDKMLYFMNKNDNTLWLYEI